MAQNTPPAASDDDIILQLQKEKEQEEKSLTPDLESLGLDQIPPVTPTPSTAPDDVWGQLQNSPTPQKPSIDPINKITDGAVKKKPDEPKKVPEKVDASTTPPPMPTMQPIVTPAPAVDPRLVGIERKDSEKVEEKQLPELGKIPAVPVTVDKAAPAKSGSRVSDIISKPIEAIKKLFSDDKKSSEQLKKEVENKATPADVIDEEQKKKDAELKALKAKELAEKRRQQRLALAELKRKEKEMKMENLRQKYLRDANDDAYEGIADYKAISVIVPKEKVPPKFLNSEIAPPLLIRVKSPENKHHPIIINNSEKIDFTFKAISEDRIEEFNALYAQIKNPNLRNSYGDTLLTFSLLMRRYDAIASILSKGADPDLKNGLGYTPLNIAIEMSDYKSTKMLIDMGAKVDYIDEGGRTYLMQATKVGSLPIVDLLISKGVGVNIADSNDVTALAIAYKYRKDIIAKYLLKFGAKSWVKKDYMIEDDTPMITDIFDKWPN